MDINFDFSALLKHHEKRRIGKPTQFSSVAGGVKKRLENNLKYRKSSRLTDFDNFRNLASCVSPALVPKPQLKGQHRRQQLEKWKEEKDKRKKEQVSQKKKPFLTGVPHNPLKFVLPPPLKPMPSTSGRVTRSQTVQSNVSKNKKKDQKQSASQSFAPSNASFKPQLKTMAKIPPLALNKPKKQTKCNVIFDPILPKDQTNTRQTRSKTVYNSCANGTKTLHTKQTENSKTIGKAIKQNIKVPKLTKHATQSSTSSDQQTSTSSSESDLNQSPIIRPSRKSICTIDLPAMRKSTPSKCNQRKSKQFTPKKPVPKSESSSEEKLRSPNSDLRTPEQIVAEAKKFSPRVTMSRGKDNARKEMKKKLEEGLLDEDASDMEAVAQFRRQVASEVERISGICREWDNISNNNLLPDVVQEAILGAVGQARLLMSQKLVQFSQLIDRCSRRCEAEGAGGAGGAGGAAGAGDAPQALVTCGDLHGFWDMVFMQIVNVDMRFKKLDEMRARNWTEEPVEIKKRVTKPAVKKVVKPAGGNSRLRDMIAAARKAKKEQEEQAKSPAPKSPAPKSPAPGATEPASKSFEAGFFCINSPVRSPILGTPRNKSLLKAVLSSEAKKMSATKNTASFAILRASVLGKSVEYEGIAPLPQTPLIPVNLNATPSRSILKSTNPTNVKSGKKSIKVVLFDQSAELLEPISPDTQINENSKTTEIKETDSGISSMDQDQEQNKENSRRKSKLIRQAAIELSPVMTRSRRKSIQTPDVSEMEGKSARKSGRKKALHESENVKDVVETPKRSSRRRKSELQSLVE